MDISRYLDRIRYRGGREPSAANLAALVRAHRLAVPYETLDLWYRRRTTLKLEELYDRIVIRRRGGYCFELNGLFTELLKALGYNVREYFGRWLLGTEDPVPKRRHRVICVAIPGHPNQIADVGIGLPFMLSPLDLTFNVPQIRDGRIYRIVRDDILTCVVEVKRGDEWMRLYSFDTAPQLPIDFEYAHWWCQTHPNSSFLKSFWVYLAEGNGGSWSVSPEDLSGTGVKTPVLAHFDAKGHCNRTELPDTAALVRALKEHFGIILGEKDCNQTPSHP